MAPSDYNSCPEHLEGLGDSEARDKEVCSVLQCPLFCIVVHGTLYYVCTLYTMIYTGLHASILEEGRGLYHGELRVLEHVT